jgi:hypothetical protein
MFDAYLAANHNTSAFEFAAIGFDEHPWTGELGIIPTAFMRPKCDTSRVEPQSKTTDDVTVSITCKFHSVKAGYNLDSIPMYFGCTLSHTNSKERSENE